ncbi:copper resistance CopC family protein [Marinomonas communis]|uniref:CopC domain-containing protein n=1 Tax=Marinomonas communis TaxID=28254 RepID=A0A4V3DGL6_9GAMM|nr:copper resistance CopC family protein [Marinomonas communis]TDR14831.1 hypothetical protein C8D85_0180 [Marinomonas communis]
MKKQSFLLGSFALVASANAFSHGMMSMMYPEDGAMMMSQAERVEMHFKAPVKLVSLKVVPEGGAPLPLSIDRSAPATEHIMVKLPQLTPNNYTVHWKAMGTDGHMMSGSYGFMQH